MNELWLAATSTSDVYEVSTLGRVRRLKPGPSTRPGKIIKPLPIGRGYLCIKTAKKRLDGKYRTTSFYIHHLVAEAFLGPRPIGNEINHKDGNKQNNCRDNLEYVTPLENRLHAKRMGLNPIGSRNKSSKLTPEQIVAIRASYRSGTRSQNSLALEYQVARCQIQNIINGKTWSHVQEQQEETE